MSYLSDALQSATNAITTQNSSVAQSWAGVAQACFALILLVVSGFQYKLYMIIRRDSLRKDRCFVVSKGLNVLPVNDHVAKKTVFLVIHRWANSGTTPTRDLTTYECWSGTGLTTKLTREYIFPVLGDKKTIPLLIGPQSEISGVTTRLTIEDLIAIQRGERYFYMWGWAWYKDIFDAKKWHTTRYCYFINEIIGDLDLPDGSTLIATANVTMHSSHNCADEECARENRHLKLRGPPYDAPLRA
jgi:hypothetical protein